MITRSNYELFIIDFYDGKLSQTQVEELHAFLDQHPDLKEEFELFSTISLEAEPIIFASKESLKKDENEIPFHAERLIAYFEGDLNKDEKSELEKELKKNSALSADLDLIKKTKVQADLAVVFENKNKLKHETKVIAFSSAFYRNLSIAASLLLISLAYFYFRGTKEVQIVAHDKKEQSPILPSDNADKNKVVGDEKQVADKVIDSTKENSLPENKKIDLPRQGSNFAVVSPLKKDKKVDSFSTPSELKEKPNTVEEKMQVAPKSPSEDQNQLANSGKATPSNKVDESHKVGGTVQVSDLSDIFTADELAELGVDLSNKSKSKEPATILDLAAAKLKNYSASKDVKLTKNDKTLKETTYALNVGKIFSVSHTEAK